MTSPIPMKINPGTDENLIQKTNLWCPILFFALKTYTTRTFYRQYKYKKNKSFSQV